MKKIMFLFVAASLMLLKSYSQTTVSYTGMGTVTCPAEPTATISPTVTGLTFSQISRGSGVTCASAPTGINGSGFNVTLANAITNSKWYSYSITSDASTLFTISNFSVVSQISVATGSPSVSVQYKIDAGAMTVVGSFTPTTTSTAYTVTPGSAISVGAGQTIHIYIIPNNLNAANTTCRMNNSSSVTVTTYSPITAGISGGTSPICSGTSPGTFTATGGGGIGTYTYNWYLNGSSTGITANTYNPGNLTADATIYCAISSGSFSPVNTSTTNIVVNPLPTATFTSPNPVEICSGQSTVLVLSFTGTGPWTFIGDDGSGPSTMNVLTNPFTASVNPIANTTYSVLSITDANTCTNTSAASAVVNVDPVSVAGTATSLTNVLCAGNGTSISLAGNTGSIQWQSSPDGLTWNDITGATNTTLLTGNLSSTIHYHAIVTSGVCSSSISNEVIITVNPLPTATFTSPNPVEICSGQSTILVMSFTGTGPWTFIGDDGTGPSTMNVPSNPFTASVNPTSNTTYSVLSITDANTCTNTSTASAVVNVDPVSVAGTATPLTNVLCAGNGTSISLAGNTGSIQWQSSPDGSMWTDVTGGTSATLSTGNLSSTMHYHAVVTSGVCSSSISNEVIITVNPIPAVPIVGMIIQTSCVVATGSVDLSGLPSGSWTINPGNITGTGITTTISGLTVGTYNYTVYDGNCTSLASSDVVIYDQTPTAPIVGTIIQPTCAVATGSVGLSGLPSGSWTINPGTITGSGTTTTISGLIAGTYNYTVNDGTCTSVATTNIIINAQPSTLSAPIVGAITQPTCAIATGSVDLSGLPSGSWTINPGTITGSGTTTTISGLTEGTYNYTVNYGACTSSASDNIIINTQPATPATPIIGTITQPTCNIATGSVELSGLPSGSWTINPGNISGSGTTTTISGLTVGTYYYTVNDGTCTSSNSTSATIIAYIPTSVTITNNSGTLTSDANSGNQWYESISGIITGETSQTYTPTVTGNYYVIVTDGNGCTATSNIITITINIVTIVEWNFPNNPDDNIADGGITANLTKTITTNSTGTVTYPTSGSTPPAGATTGSARNTGWDAGMDSKYWEVEFTTLGYQDITLSSRQRSSATGPRDFKVQYSIDNTTWTDIAGAAILDSNDYIHGVLPETALPIETYNQSSMYVRWIMTSNNAVNGSTVPSTGVSNIDDIYVKGLLITNNSEVELNKTFNLTVYPNPAFDRVMVNVVNGISSTVKLEILSLEGRVIYKNEIKNGENSTLDINLKNYSAGIYFVKAISQEKIIVQKLIKQ